ncbi:L-histidine N(alpha)-methyltransferase [Planotetraspora phitsanulokensis]|uniref:L-histidine N(alpha)-methyltransferase n=1 Tax=Planotetraspora phitsanulokensis TaxID=575192 RepID=UPI0019512324|nr:L-histidine N(alpha)-methyltransferase [Planotetraspora phitsanulokensis]
MNLEGEDPRKFLADLVLGLKGTTGGKKIENRHRYIGLRPTITWLQSASDPSYPVAYDSNESFARLWDLGQAALDEDTPYHYVSLGVGDGNKDRHVIDRLGLEGSDRFYIGIDISSHMLRLGTSEATHRMPGRVLPIELDFEGGQSIRALRELLDSLVDHEPILFSLLGNTLGNMDRDLEFTRTLTALLRPQDRLAVEVGTTERLDAAAAAEAARERDVSRSYKEFATAALGMYTNLSIDTNWLEFTGSIEEEHAVRVEGRYLNKSGQTIPMMLPNGETIPYAAQEGIRVLLGRKYSLDGLRRHFSVAGLSELSVEATARRSDDLPGAEHAGFGLALMVLKYEPQGQQPSKLGKVWGPQTVPPMRTG